MKKNTKFDLLFASISAAALLMFMSCGHQSRRGDDGLFADMEQDRGSESSEVNVPSEGSGETTQREISKDLVATSDSEASAMIEDKSASVDKSSDPTSLGGEEKAAKGGDDLSALTEVAKPETNKVAQLDTAPPAAESLPPMEEAAPAPVAAAPEAKVEAPAALPPMDQSKSASELLAQITVPTPDTTTTASEEMPAPEAAPAKKVSTAPKGARKAGKGVSLPKDSLWKKGHTMNRFYFLRNGDTAEKMAEVIYGDKTKAEDLASWNPGTWSSGKVIMFESAVTPNDTEMKSFYEERELPSEAYTVKKGDKLATIAEAIYGDKQSWQEIAALNNLPKNAKLAEGTVLNVFPKALPAVEKEEPVVAKVEEAPQDKIAAIVASKEPVKEEPVAKAAPEPEAKMVKREHVKRASLANAQVGGGFLEEHIAAMLGGMLILLASFFAFRYFRRTRELQD